MTPEYRKIPGYLNDEECRILSHLARGFNHPGSVIVEIGSLHGKSSEIIASAAFTAKVYCIDPWYGHDSSSNGISVPVAMSRGWPIPGTLNTLEFFKENTKTCTNILPMKALSPYRLNGWSTRCDMVFLDAMHANPSDRDNIDFWIKMVNPGGMFVGHDYYEIGGDWPDVRENVIYLEELLGQHVTNPPNTSLWYFTL